MLVIVVFIVIPIVVIIMLVSPTPWCSYPARWLASQRGWTGVRSSESTLGGNSVYFCTDTNTNTQIHIYTNTQIHKYTNTFLHSEHGGCPPSEASPRIGIFSHMANGWIIEIIIIIIIMKIIIIIANYHSKYHYQNNSLGVLPCLSDLPDINNVSPLRKSFSQILLPNLPPGGQPL